LENPDRLAQCVEQLQSDGLVAFPTETVWGLAARADSGQALARLASVKGRDSGKPISILVPGSFCLEALGFEVPDLAERLMVAHWPGPLTLVLRCRRAFAPGIARLDGAVGVRCSSHPAASALARAAFDAELGPLTATSLNRSGDPPARTRAEARKLCEAVGSGERIPLYDAGFEAGGEEPSTVLDVTGDVPRVLRAGAVQGIPEADSESAVYADKESN